MAQKHRICIAEDHTILRAGICSLLASNANLEVVDEVGDGLELIESIKKHCPDLVIMDLSMPRMRGLEAIQQIKARHPEKKILVLTMHDTEEYIQAALQAGALGYILKDSTHEELMLAISTVLKGKTYLSPDVSGKVLQGYLEGKQQKNQATTAWDTLTNREREILKLIAEGNKNKEIADFLHMSIKTVETHRTNLMRKLNVHSATELTVYAMEKGLVNNGSVGLPM